MPLFTSFSWPTQHLGPLASLLARINIIESLYPSYAAKIDKVIWRGTPHFSPPGTPSLRHSLLAATKHKAWADVLPYNASTALPIEQFCRYKYVVYTEGVGYSGRLPYHQACESVLITAPLGWVTVSAGLLRPIFAGDLIREVTGGGGGGRDGDRRDGVVETVGSYRDANAIYVASDFGDLEGLVGVLRGYEYVAERVARNQRDLVVGKGYLSIAAETCYWRALIRAWSESAVVNERDWVGMEGERYETWLLKEVSTPREGTRAKVRSGG
jgi:hypothetical protein